MLSDRYIALDCLESAKTGVKELTSAALESSNPNLRQFFIQLRNQEERDQQEIYELSEKKGWYLVAGKADQQEVNRVHSFYQQNIRNFAYQTPGQMGYQGYPVSNVNQPGQQFGNPQNRNY